MREKRLEIVKKEIRSVIITYPTGVTLESFLRAYKQLVGLRLPSREFGYTTDVDFLHSLPDVVHVKVDRNGEYQLNCIADEATEHIQKLVVKQKTTKPKPKRNIYPPRPIIFKEFNTKPFVSATLRENLFKVLSDYPDGLNYHSLLLAYRKMFKRPLNLEFLSDNNEQKLEKLAIAVAELNIKTINDTVRLFYCPLVRKKKETNIENINYTKKSEDFHQNLQLEIKQSENEVEKPEISAIPQVVKKDFEKVLKLYPDGILAKHFPFTYEKVSGEMFDILDLGFNNFIELADALPDLFICVKPHESPNDWILFHPCFSEKASLLKEKNKNLELSEVKQKKQEVENKAVPYDIALPTLSYAPPQFPTDMNLSVYIPVFITAVKNPSYFWFKIRTHDVICRFRELEEEMQSFYHSADADVLFMSINDVNIGTTCVALHEDHWYRVTVTSSPIEECVNVYFVDYGDWENIHCSQLRYLKYSFITLPSQAFKAQLANVKPAKGNKQWSRRAEYRFLQLCSNLYLVGRIHLEFEDIVTIFLCDTSGNDDIHINDTLIDEGLAEACTDDILNYPIESSETSEGLDSDSVSHSAFSNGNNNRNQLSQSSTTATENKCKDNPKLVKRICLGDGYKIHLILFSQQAYVSADDLCSMFWVDKSVKVLQERLEFKNVEIPTLTLSNQDHKELFQQCENHSVKGFKLSSTQDYSVTLYPLVHVMKVLNTVGHPSVRVRETIKTVMKYFDARNEKLDEISYISNNIQEETNHNEDVINSYCLYDLKALYEGIKYKRLIFMNNINDSNTIELKRLEAFSERLQNRIDYITSICSSYSR